LHEFHINKKSKDGHQCRCKECSAVYNRAYRAANRERVLAQKRKWGEANRDKNRDYRRAYRAANKEQIAITRRAWLAANSDYFRKRRATDVPYKIQRNLRARLHAAIKRNSKSGSAVRDLGCSIEELKKHLEVQFEEGMTWDNWTTDGWHIDHIRPLASFDLTDREQLLEAVHYTNLQPLWAEENLRKGKAV